MLYLFLLFGLMLFYVVFIGVLLWVLSLFVGWVDNWFVLYWVGDVFVYNCWLCLMFGVVGVVKFVYFCCLNVVGVVVNVGFGLMFGLILVIVIVFMFLFEVWYVMLLVGLIGIVFGVLGKGVFSMFELWWVGVGVLSMVIFNVFVSFVFVFMMVVCLCSLCLIKVCVFVVVIVCMVLLNLFVLFWLVGNFVVCVGQLGVY